MELPGQLELMVTGLFLLHCLVLLENPLALVMHPLEHLEEALHSDQEAVLVTPGLTMFLTHSPW